ncbi:MAG: XamI family restriction endonuclease [Acidobacteriaceae bacterium]
MKNPPDWSEEQLRSGLTKAIALFREERMDEPLEAYGNFFEEYQGAFEDLLETSVDLAQLDTTITKILTDKKLLEAFRYLAGPPISVDDLKVLAEANLSQKQIKADPEMVQRVLGVVRHMLDSRRFPWVKDEREPTEAEHFASVIASAALIANSRTGTLRRNKGQRDQEAVVRKGLLGRKFIELKRRKVVTLSEAPVPGHFCAESILGSTRADFIVGLWDRRVMGIECKVSNSSVNSYKRVNHEAAGKAASWLGKFGTNGVVPVAVLSGVYNLGNLIEAQSRGLTIFWAHDLDELLDWIEATKN